MNEEYLLQIALELRDEASRNIAEANREMDKMKTQMKTLEEGAKKASNSMELSFEKVARASKIMLAGITAAAAGSIKTYADMEKGIKKVETVSNKSFEEIKRSATDLATTYGISIGEVLEGNYDMVSSMGDIAKSQEVLSTAAQLSIAGFTSFGGAINALSSVMNAYKMEAGEATNVSDMLMNIQNRGVVVIGELQAVLSNVVPTAAAMGIEFRDVAAALATMTSNKVPAAQATTQLRAAFAELAKEGTTVSKKFREITGVSFQEFIAQGGTVAEAFDLIEKNAKKSSESLYDVFGSIEAANGVINLTGINAGKFSDNLKGMENSAGTTQRSFEKMSESFSFQIAVLKEKALVGARTLGEQLTPQVKDLVDWINKIDWKVVFSQENIESVISIGKTIGTIALTLWGVEKALHAVKIAQAAWNVVTLANPYIAAGAAIVATVGGVATYLTKQANDRKKEINDTADAQIAALERVKKAISKGGTGASELDFVKGFDNLKELLNSGDIQGGLREIENQLKKIKGVEIQLSPEEEMLAIGGGKGYLSTFKSNEKKSPGLNPVDPVIEDQKKKYKEFMDSLKSELESLPKIWEALGVYGEDEKQLLELKGVLESGIREAARNGFTKAIPDLQKKLEATNLKLNLFEENREADSQAKEDATYKQQEAEKAAKALKEEKEKEASAIRDAISALNDMGQSLSQASNIMKSEFISGLSGIVNSINGMINSLSSMSKSAGGLSSILPSGLLSGLTGGLNLVSGGVGLVTGAIGMAETVATSLLGGKTSADIAKKNEQQKELYKQNTDALKSLGEAIAANTQKLQGLSMALLSNVAKSPTLSKISTGNTVFDSMIDAMMDDKNFGQVSAIKKGSKRNWYGKKKSTYTNVDISEDRLMELAGVSKKDIDDMTLAELKAYREGLNNVNNSMLGSNITESNLDEYKKNLSTFIGQVEMLEKEQQELFKSATMENFEGINFIEEKQLIQEYTDMFKDMGIDVEKYSDVIKEMAEANQVLVTSMEDVRQSMIENIVSGDGSFVSSMGSYFKKIFNNMASVIYDVTFSEIDQYFSDAFKTISEKLVDIKKQGGDMVGSMTDLLNSMDLSKLLEADKMNIEFDKVIDSFREKLESLGMSTDLINSLLPPTALSEKIESLRNMLSGAMKSALDIMDFDTFNKSLGQSLYENVKSGLIQAFTETELYKGLMNKFMPDIDNMFSGAGSFEDAFDIMKDYLDKFEKELEAGGMGFVNNATTESTEDKTLGNSFYNDANKVSIVIEQNFNGSFVGDYDFRRLARDGAVDALKVMNEEVKLVGGF